LHEAAEEHGVAGLVDLLRGEEVLLLLTGTASMYGDSPSATASSPQKKSA
jgi:hypothetical protein